MNSQEAGQPVQENTHTVPGEGSDRVLLSTHPEKLSFAFKYFLAFTPCILVGVSILARYFLDIIFRTFSTAVTSSITNPLGNSLAVSGTSAIIPGSLSNLGSSLAYGTNVTILLIAPIGIFIIFAVIGWSMRSTEMWTSVTMTLILSGITGLLLVIMTGTGGMQDNFLLYLEWIAFLVQPFCIIATVIALLWLEKFRKSLQYTITDQGIWFRGGVGKKQEHLVLHSEIGRVVLEQNFFGTRHNFGTVIPVSSTPWGDETSFRGFGATGQKDNFGGGILFAKSRHEASRSPLDCLFGIPNPRAAQKILTEVISRRGTHEAEQVLYLKKISERGINGPAFGEQNVPQTASSGVTEHTKTDPDMTEPQKRTAPDNETVNTGDVVTRVNGPDPLATTTTAPTPGIREILPVKQIKNSPKPTIPPAESIPDLIKKLAELRDEKIITEQEFEAKKTELLKRM